MIRDYEYELINCKGVQSSGDYGSIVVFLCATTRLLSLAITYQTPHLKYSYRSKIHRDKILEKRARYKQQTTFRITTNNLIPIKSFNKRTVYNGRRSATLQRKLTRHNRSRFATDQTLVVGWIDTLNEEEGIFE
ncbi:unnamed protein product [Cercopithifilaria johnstoni]|uniref:Uncharacterized protein n=1 Tax=Cercopithifilaria johnstoni TaxID=2874296 RepID=A0A8J2LYW1_9BILA|nr:unnamed protein product [Cercopithifilaria johnstoni]